MKVLILLGLVAFVSSSRFARNTGIYDKANCEYNATVLADNEDAKLCVVSEIIMHVW